jgi:hypothetical protein
VSSLDQLPIQSQRVQDATPTPRTEEEAISALGSSNRGPVVVLSALALLTAGSAYSPASALQGPSSPGSDKPAWVARYNGPSNSADLARALALSPDGRQVFVVGESVSGAFDFGLVAYSARSGRSQWTARYDGPAGGNDWGYAVAVSPDGGRVFVTGPSEQRLGFPAPADYATVAYDAATGSELWVARYDGPAHEEDSAFSVAVSPGGSSVFVTGTSHQTASNNDYATIAYDAVTGAQLWVARYDGPAGDRDTAYNVRVGPDGYRVFVSGFSMGDESSEDYATVAYDAVTGDQLWVARYNGTGNYLDVPYGMAVSPDGLELFVTGTSHGSGFGLYQDYATVAYDAATGSELWVARYTTRRAGADLAFAVAVSPDGERAYVTGQSSAALSNDDYATVAYDAATGSQLGAGLYDGPGVISDAAYAVAVSPAGKRVFVTGGSYGADFDEDFATVVYHAGTGAELRVERYDAGDNDRATSLAVSSNGRRIYVTGHSVGPASSFDYATLAYGA